MSIGLCGGGDRKVSIACTLMKSCYRYADGDVAESDCGCESYLPVRDTMAADSESYSPVRDTMAANSESYSPGRDTMAANSRKVFVLLLFALRIH